MVKVSIQSDVVYWSNCSQTLPHSSSPQKNVPNWVLNQKKTLLFLLGKVENDKYPNTLRISDNLLTLPHGPIYKFGSKKCLFLLNFTRVLWFLWDLGLTSFEISKDVVFPEFWFQAIFLVFWQKIGSQN